MAEVISFTNAQITQLSHLFGDEIMTGSEISRVLERIGIQDNSGASTKWCRLEYAFTERQNCDRAGNAILQFIQEVLAPVNYVHLVMPVPDPRSQTRAPRGMRASRSSSSQSLRGFGPIILERTSAVSKLLAFGKD